VVQVAALVREADALALAEALHQRNFPAFVVEPQTDHFYRVQVGPYADIRSAKSVLQQLKSQGFESIIKHRGA
jgi:cell division septation protein DedD